MLIDDLLEKLKYKREPYDKRISSTMLNREPLELVMSVAHCNEQLENFSQATFGSLVHKGLESLFKDDNTYNPEVEVEYEDEDYRLTSTIDLIEYEEITECGGEDCAVINRPIAFYDWKTTKHFTVKKLIENIEKGNLLDNDYILQLNFSRYIWANKYGELINNLYLVFLLKDGGWDYRSKLKKEDIKIVKIPTIDFKEIEQKINTTKELLDNYIDFDAKEVKSYPEQCDAKYGFITYKDGSKKSSKCALYCSYKNICPKYYESDTPKGLEW